jgi:superfamily II DNA/RNA helicase
MGFKQPTPIQSQAIPPALQGRDLIGCAQNGTGKTAAFGIPLAAKLLRVPHRTALVLVPTRELANQIQKVLLQLTAESSGIGAIVLIEGKAMNTQIRELSLKPRIVIATPGRLVEHLRRGTLSLSSAELVVLDEADRMLDLGFGPQLHEIVRFLPKSRQTLLFSATLPPEIRKLAQKLLKDPVEVTVQPEPATSPATQSATKVTSQATAKPTPAKSVLKPGVRLKAKLSPKAATQPAPRLKQSRVVTKSRVVSRSQASQ